MRKIASKTNNMRLFHGDCLEVLRTLPDNSVDSCVTDPPYGLSREPDINEVLTKWLAGEPYDHGHGGFMGKAWDSFVPHPDIWREVYRVLKPGGHALVFAGTRTQDLMTISLRLAGFEVRDVIEWLYFSGFPKSMDVGKAFDKRAKTELARKWDGWGTALKPAHEPIIVVRKPLIDADTGRKMIVADCVEKYGTGAVNIDEARIAYLSEEDKAEARPQGKATAKSGSLSGKAEYPGCDDFAPDVLNPEEDDRDICTTCFYRGIDHRPRKEFEFKQKDGRFPANCVTTEPNAFYSKYFDVTADAIPNVSPAELSKKASKSDRNSDWCGEEITLESRRAGALQGRNDGSLGSVTYNRNTHPTVKPIDLMAWLVRLVTPPNGTILDPFAGSGSTLVAARREGFGFIGCEITDEYIPIIEARVGINAETIADDSEVA